MKSPHNSSHVIASKSLEALIPSCDALKSRGSLTNSQHAGIPMDIVCLDTTLFNPIYRDSFIYIQRIFQTKFHFVYKTKPFGCHILMTTFFYKIMCLLWVADFRGLTIGYACLPKLSRTFTVGHICITKNTRSFP